MKQSPSVKINNSIKNSLTLITTFKLINTNSLTLITTTPFSLYFQTDKYKDQY